MLAIGRIRDRVSSIALDCKPVHDEDVSLDPVPVRRELASIQADPDQLETRTVEAQFRSGLLRILMQIDPRIDQGLLRIEIEAQLDVRHAPGRRPVIAQHHRRMYVAFVRDHSLTRVASAAVHGKPGNVPSANETG